MEPDPEPIEIFGFIVDESDPLGAAIAEIVDIPWYVAFFWMAVGMALVLVIVFILFLLWNS